MRARCAVTQDVVLALCAVVALSATSACKRSSRGAPAAATSGSAAVDGALGPPAAAPPPKQGMVWIAGGALVAGTPPDAFPRVADEEMPGEQVILKGFYIDVFPFPNEDGAIPLASSSQSEAAALCEEKGKRLCSELEWERACKGPNNLVYEYGNVHRPERCATGSTANLRPNGFLVGCKSEFGVRDMHGGLWEWTSSAWGRGSPAVGDHEARARALVTLRGGNAPQGELVGRCANGIGRPPETKTGNIGFRCCAGEANQAEVVLRVVRGKQLDFRDAVNKELAQYVLGELPEEAKKDIGDIKRFRFERSWIWRPIGNEELNVLAGCSGLAVNPACGIVVVRSTLTKPKILAWVSSGHWTPMLHMDADPRDLWLFGGDELGQFRRIVGYVWGTVSVGDKERRVPKPPKKKKK